MPPSDLKDIFSDDVLKRLLPPVKADAFFDALYGDASEGAFDISLAFINHNPANNSLNFEFRLAERPGKCLACNLTYGLPEVFSRHPQINVKGMVGEIDNLLGDAYTCSGWSLGHTRTPSRSLHIIPLIVKLG